MLKNIKIVCCFFVINCNNEFLTKTKLNKLFYYLDFICFRDNEKNVTGDNYIKMQYGPVPSEIEKVKKELEKENLIEIKRDNKLNQDGSEYFKETYKSKVKTINESLFSEYEKKLLECIKNEFTDYDINKIVLTTHLEAPWVYTKDNEIIDYKLSYDIEFFENELKN